MRTLLIGRKSEGLPALFYALCLGLLLSFPTAVRAQGPASVADLADKLIDAVVNISTAQTVTGNRRIPMPQVPEGSPFQEFFDEFFDKQNQGDDRPRKVQSLGSGFVIDAAGLVITNNHVIEGADEITVNFNDGSTLDAEIVGRDTKTDLAVLRVKPKANKPLTAVKFGNSGVLRVGDWVMAIGNPFGLGGTVTLGIVSARNRDINSGPYDNFLQTDASINRGNSGGPLFNMDGEVIGINTAIISPSGGSIGIGFAIPADTATSVIAQLEEFGETRRGWLGVRIQQVTDEIAESLGMDRALGALVAGVTATGPADKAGIEPGDVVVKFDGKTVPTMRDLPRMVADTSVGKTVDVVVLRKGKELTVKVDLGRLEEGEKLETAEKSVQPQVEMSVLGLKLKDMSQALRDQYSIAESVEGVVITEVEANSPAAEKRIQAGDVIVEVSQEKVFSPDAVSEAVKKLKQAGRKSALLLLAGKDGELRFVAVRIDG